MCNVVLTIAVLDTYTSSFFLSAMSVARHCTVAGALHPGRRGAPWASGVRSLLWVTAVLATTLTALRGGVSICACCASATAAPTDLQKIAVAFVLPLATLGTCWLRRLLQRRRAGWQSRVRPRWRSLARALLVFVVCWLPHQALTLLGGGGWRGVDRADRMPWDRTYFLAQSLHLPGALQQLPQPAAVLPAASRLPPGPAGAVWPGHAQDPPPSWLCQPRPRASAPQSGLSWHKRTTQ
jgi:hypothetical protein